MPFLGQQGLCASLPSPRQVVRMPAGMRTLRATILRRLRRPARTMGLRPPRFSIVASAPSACRSFRTASPGRCFGYWPRSPAVLGKSLRFLCLSLATPCLHSGTRALRLASLSPPSCQLVRMPADMRTLRAVTLQQLRLPARTIELRSPRFSIVAAMPSACRLFRTAPPGRCFDYWLRSSAALGRSLRFLLLPLAAPCHSLGSRGFALRLPLPAALPARPHACGHANIARCNFTAASPPSRNDGAPPHTPAGT